MKLLAPLTLLFFLCLCLAPVANAGLLLYDGFNYTSTQALSNQASWDLTGASGSDPTIGSGSLSYPGMPASVGNDVSFDSHATGGARITIPGQPYTNTTVYWSAMFKATDLDTLTTGPGSILIGGFNNGTGPQAGLPGSNGAILVMQRDASDLSNQSYFIGTGVQTATGNRVFDPTAHQIGDTLLLVVSYTQGPGTSDDYVNMWVNPNALDLGSPTPPTPTVVGTLMTGSELLNLGIQSFGVRNVSTVGTPLFQMDELRIGTDWASVTGVTVPEPAMISILGIGAVVGLLVRRRRAA